MTEPATDKHLDELSKRVDFGFDQTGQRLGRVEDDVRALRTEMNARFDKVDGKFEKVDGEFTAVRGEMKAGFDGLQRQMTRFFAGTLGTIIAGVIVSAILSHL
jgi:tetrahydromethanopterin S-methyltransferase subunit G